MAEVVRQKLNDSATARWIVLIIVATAMMMGYCVNDVMSPLETLLEMPQSKGGLGWTPADYGFFSGSSGLINVFLLMLFFSGIILDKMGIRFTGVLACSLMVLGTLIKYYAVIADFPADSTFHFSLFTYHFTLPLSVAVASDITVECRNGMPKDIVRIVVQLFLLNLVFWVFVEGACRHHPCAKQCHGQNAHPPV